MDSPIETTRKTGEGVWVVYTVPGMFQGCPYKRGCPFPPGEGPPVWAAAPSLLAGQQQVREEHGTFGFLSHLTALRLARAVSGSSSAALSGDEEEEEET